MSVAHNLMIDVGGRTKEKKRKEKALDPRKERKEL
jgi:hypothetical protein